MSKVQVRGRRFLPLTCGCLPPLKLGRWGSLSSVITNDIGGIGSIELVRTIAWCVERSILEDYLLLRIDDEHTIIELIGNTCIPIFQAHRVCWKRRQIAAWLGIGEVLKDDLLVRVYLNNAGMTRIGDQCIPIRKPTGKGGK